MTRDDVNVQTPSMNITNQAAYRCPLKHGTHDFEIYNLNVTHGFPSRDFEVSP